MTQRERNLVIISTRIFQGFLQQQDLMVEYLQGTAGKVESLKTKFY